MKPTNQTETDRARAGACLASSSASSPAAPAGKEMPMTAIETLAAEQTAYEAKTEAFRVAGEPFTIADARRIFEKVQNKDHWKKPWAAAVPAIMVEAVIKAVEFYHADRAQIVGMEPLTGRVLMEGRGYMAD
jgi:hypothetical protein